MSPTSSPSRWPKWLPIVGWTALGLLAAVLVMWMITVSLGAVHGIEFSPHTFERRSYSFYEVPLIGYQVTAIEHEDVSKPTETILGTNKFVVPPPGGQQDWHIVIGTRWPKSRRRGDASILMQYFDAQDGASDYRWSKWSEDNPKLAKVFWPAVQRLAVHELYVFMPDLFDLAKRYDDPAQLKQALDKHVVEHLLVFGRRLQSRDQHAEAVKVLDDALKLDPANQELKRARETSKTAAGAGEKSNPAPARKTKQT